MKLELIADTAARKSSLRKRKKGLLKKMQELSILCDVDACAVIYGADESYPEVWPSPVEATGVLKRFRDLPEIEQKRKMINQTDFLNQKIRKLVDQLRKQELDNKEMEMKIKLYEALRTGNFNELNVEQATIMSKMIELNLKKIFDKIGTINKHQGTSTAVLHVDGVLNSVTRRENMPREEEKEKDTLWRQQHIMDMMIQTHQPPRGPTNPWPDSFFPFNI